MTSTTTPTHNAATAASNAGSTRRYFGTDGIRGLVGQPPITPEFAMRLGMAVGHVVQRNQAGTERPAVLIGKDTRVSGYMLESALEAGFSAVGCDVTLVGPMPTAGVAYLTRAHRHALGVVISASHNPFADNGIKFFSSQGDKLPDAWELAVEQRLETPPACQPSERLGKARRLDDAAGRYIEFCKSTFPYHHNLRGMKLVVDCAHGAAYHIAPAVFHELGAEVHAIGVKPDGFNINAGCGATDLSAVRRHVQEVGADYGIALDGDADRVIFVDAQDRVYDGDSLLLVLAQHQRATGVVGTLMTNFAVERALRERGIDFARANVGDRYVLELLKEKGWLLGGEGSGHLLNLARHSTGDGVISALQVLAAVMEGGKTLAQWLADYRALHQTLLNVRVARPKAWQGEAEIEAAIQRAEQRLGSAGRVLLRASGTEPVLRVMVEADDQQLAQQLAQDIAQVVEARLKA